MEVTFFIVSLQIEAFGDSSTKTVKAITDTYNSVDSGAN